MRLPGFHAEATLEVAPLGRYRTPARRTMSTSGVQAQAEPCQTCEDCYVFICQDLGWDHPACTHCRRNCGPCPRIPETLDP